MIGDEERRVLRAKAFAWRAIGCAVWLGIILVLVIFAMMVLQPFTYSPEVLDYFR